jgi:hypothetical protein
MLLAYRRNDGFPKFSCGMEMWVRKDGRLFVRFISPGLRTTYRTYELLGIQPPSPPKQGELFDDNCVPNVLRDLYEDWVEECIWYPDDID